MSLECLLGESKIDYEAIVEAARVKMGECEDPLEARHVFYEECARGLVTAAIAQMVGSLEKAFADGKFHTGIWGSTKPIPAQTIYQPTVFAHGGVMGMSSAEAIMAGECVIPWSSIQRPGVTVKIFEE